MTSKERVKAALNWKTPDKIPVHEDFWTDTLEVWKKQGLPKNVRISPVDDTESISADNYFNFDLALMFLDCSPRYEQKIIFRDGENYTFEDRYGYTAEKPWQKSGSIHFKSVKTISQEIWQQDKKRWTLSDDPAELAG